MYVTILINRIAFAMHRNELKNLELTGHEAVMFSDTLEEAVYYTNKLNS